ncbi:response regulator [Actinomyces oricola]
MNYVATASSTSVGSGDNHVRVLIVDDHPVVRSGLMGMLDSAAGIAVVGQAADGDEAVRLSHRLKPDVVLMDLRMPGVDGVTATRLISAGAGTAHSAAGAGTAHSAAGSGGASAMLGATGMGTARSAAGGRSAVLQRRRTDGSSAVPDDMAVPRVVVLTTYDSDEDILPAVEAGAIGYLLKDSPRSDILAAVRAAANGRGVLSPRVTARLVQAACSSHGVDVQTPPDLSPREHDIVVAVSRGLSNSRIAAELCIAEATVKTYLKRVFHKLGVDSRAAAVAQAVRFGMLELD